MCQKDEYKKCLIYQDKTAERKRQIKQYGGKAAWTIEKYNLFGNKWHAMPSYVCWRWSSW